jgi:anti-sigma B factor antagonist
MNRQVERLGAVTVLTVAEPALDASNAGEFKTLVQELLHSTSRLVVDLSLVEFVDSCGCGAILTALRWLDKVGGELRLCRLTERVEAVFGLFRMGRIFEICATREDAVRSFTRQPEAC